MRSLRTNLNSRPEGHTLTRSLAHTDIYVDFSPIVYQHTLIFSDLMMHNFMFSRKRV